MARVQFNKNINIGRVVAKLTTVIIALYVGGTIVNEVGAVMNGTTSAFNRGLALIGWTVDDNGLITSTSGTGILSVIGIVGVASIVLEFVKFRM